MKLIALIVLIAAMAFPGAAHGQELKTDYVKLARALKAKPALSLTAVPLPAARQDAGQQRDSVWNGTLIGAGIGAASGYVWARAQCGNNDSECFVIAGTVGIIGGAAIGAAVGAVADALHK